MVGADPHGTTATLTPGETDPGDPGGEPWRAGDRIGRYRVVEKLGAGGMGVVYLADDPELDRRVALKLVRSAARTGAQADLVVEAQAMARLQHPNVVTVYDVGMDRGRVFVAMELVAGVTLRDWLRAERRRWRDIVSAFVGAARGLAAAHRAGLVHRDFKPDNVLIDRGGVARLSDFGLARPPAGDRAAAGTPPYMAPEQHDGDRVTEAVDQFAFAAALWEAVFGALPFAGDDVAALAEAKRLGRIAPPPRGAAPGWLAAVLRRALAPAPGERFASLAALERALERGLARRRRAAIAVAGLAAAALAFAVGGLRTPGGAAPCTGAAAEIARSWTPAARARVTGHLRGLDAYGGAEAARLDGELAAAAAGWAGAHRDACLANARGELTAALYGQALACLERSRMALDAALDVLAVVPRDRLSDAIVAARSLPEPARCRGETLVAGVAPPPPELAVAVRLAANELERVRVRARARDPAAEAAAADALARSEQLGYPPLIAQARLIDGLAAMARDPVRAAAALDRAATTALGAGDDATFVEAYAREIFAIGIIGADQLPPHAADALGAIAFAEQVAIRLGAAASFARPLLFNNAGIARRAAGDSAGARAWYQKAIDEPRTRGGDIELASAYGNLALVTDDPARRAELLASEAAVLERRLGPDHVMTLDARLKASIFIADPVRAAALLRELRDRYRRSHPTTAASRIHLCAYQLGWLAEERGDLAEARAELAAIPPGAGKQGAVAQVYLARLAGALDQAVRDGRAAADRLEAKWWTRIYAVDALIVAAQAQAALARPGDAIATLQRARTLLDSLASLEAGEDRPRRLARVRGQLAILEAPRDRALAHDYARDAAAWYRRAGGYDARAEALEAIARATATAGSR
jgi:hypothetical protein